MSTTLTDPFTEERLIILRAPARPAMRDLDAGPVAMSAEATAGITIDIDSKVSKSTMRTIANDPTVVGFCPSLPMTLIEPVPTPRLHRSGVAATTWGVDAVGATTSPYTGSGITVAVLDTGIDSTHPAFSGVELITRDFTGDGSVIDKHGHGTHCAGTIFGRDLNSKRIGVASGVNRALIGKVLGADGGGTDILTQAMIWARDNGAHVISMSLGIDFPGYVNYLIQQRGYRTDVATSVGLQAYTANVRLFEKLSEFLNAGLGQPLVVAATGNESGRHANPPYEINVSPPAAAAGIIAVGALDSSADGFVVAPFSNTRATVSAPGVGIESAGLGGGTTTMSGTSMATPHVAGVAALWAEKLRMQGQLSPLVLQAKIIGDATCDPLAPGFDPLDVGAGLVQAPQS